MTRRGRSKVRRAAAVRQRIERKKTCALFAPQRLRNPVSGEWIISIKRIAERSGKGTEVTVPERNRRHRGQGRFLLAAPLSLITNEEKCLVLPDRTPEYSA